MALRVAGAQDSTASPDVNQLFDEAAIALRRLVVAYRQERRRCDPDDVNDPRIGGYSESTWVAVECSANMFAIHSGIARGV
jgi:hypothetical protein